MSKRTRYEVIRRLRLGDLRCVLRHRCGHELPDDDAGCEYLTELLRLSLDKHLANVIEIWAPWLDPIEADQLVTHIRSLPDAVRRSSPEALGQRLRLTFVQRKKLGVRQIAPCDLTQDQLREHRKARRRAQEQERRQRRGAVSRDQYRQNAEALRAEAAALGITYKVLRQRKLRQAKHVASACQKQKQGVASAWPINSNYQARTCDNAAGLSRGSVLDGLDKLTTTVPRCSAQAGEVREHEPASETDEEAMSEQEPTAWSKLPWATMTEAEVKETMALMEAEHWARAPAVEARKAREESLARGRLVDAIDGHRRDGRQQRGAGGRHVLRTAFGSLVLSDADMKL